MIDVTSELDKLKNKLMLDGFNESEASDICESAANSIRDAVVDLLADTMENVAMQPEANNHNFIKELMATRDGSLFRITTSSGRTDFSEPPFPMLPKLLENAKVSKEGSRYKKIPMRAKTSDSSIPKTIENAVKQINQQREIMKAEKDARRESARDPLASISIIKTDIDEKQSRFNSHSSVATQFRTASDKQDPNSRWVYPARKADMSNLLDNANSMLQDEIDMTIKMIISQYGGYV